jgi:hypothetical protein
MTLSYRLSETHRHKPIKLRAVVQEHPRRKPIGPSGRGHPSHHRGAACAVQVVLLGTLAALSPERVTAAQVVCAKSTLECRISRIIRLPHPRRALIPSAAGGFRS